MDLEPGGSGVATDVIYYVNFLSKLKFSLNNFGTRLTLDVVSANWDPVMGQFGLLAPTVDRLIDMETYHANSMEGWLNGDKWGGFYTNFVNDEIPRMKNAVGLGCYEMECGDEMCWSVFEESGKPRIKRLIEDGVPEIALFRIEGNQTRPGNERLPQEWWWPLLWHYYNHGF